MDDKNISHQQAYNLFDFEHEFREYLSAVIHLKKISIRNYMSDVRYYFGWAQSHRDVKTLESFFSLESLVEYRNSLIADGIPTKTINRRLSSLRCLCDYLVSQNRILENPAKQLQNHGSHKRKEIDDSVIEAYIAELAQNGLNHAQRDEIRHVLEDMETSLIHFSQHI